jgi:hypothetical protein
MPYAKVLAANRIRQATPVDTNVDTRYRKTGDLRVSDIGYHAGIGYRDRQRVSDIGYHAGIGYRDRQRVSDIGHPRVSDTRYRETV